MQKNADGEYEDTKGKTNRELLQKQKNMLKEQDKHLDELGGIVKNIHYENENFGQEVGYQNKLLTKLGTDMDKTTNKMVKVDNRLKELVYSSKACCLWIIIIIEIIVLILVCLI